MAQQPTDQQHAPPPVTMAKLRRHFRDQYLLTDPQVELMLTSSSKSLEQSLENLAEGIAAKDMAVDHLKAVYHGLKGVLLNMGESEWADYTRAIEQKILAGEPLDHRRIEQILRDGMVEVLTYCGKPDAGPLKGAS
ncbi:MAG: hypothetical protein OEL83_07455 [Desulforhopalus sp.]|nr:hypothetical protein [Desulforhopalus sp.]